MAPVSSVLLILEELTQDIIDFYDILRSVKILLRKFR
jgi:hypothetical protein